MSPKPKVLPSRLGPPHQIRENIFDFTGRSGGVNTASTGAVAVSSTENSPRLVKRKMFIPAGKKKKKFQQKFKPIPCYISTHHQSQPNHYGGSSPLINPNHHHSRHLPCPPLPVMVGSNNSSFKRQKLRPHMNVLQGAQPPPYSAGRGLVRKTNADGTTTRNTPISLPLPPFAVAAGQKQHCVLQQNSSLRQSSSNHNYDHFASLNHRHNKVEEVIGKEGKILAKWIHFNVSWKRILLLWMVLLVASKMVLLVLTYEYFTLTALISLQIFHGVWTIAFFCLNLVAERRSLLPNTSCLLAGYLPATTVLHILLVPTDYPLHFIIADASGTFLAIVTMFLLLRMECTEILHEARDMVWAETHQIPHHQLLSNRSSVLMTPPSSPHLTQQYNTVPGDAKSGYVIQHNLDDEDDDEDKRSTTSSGQSSTASSELTNSTWPFNSSSNAAGMAASARRSKDGMLMTGSLDERVSGKNDFLANASSSSPSNLSLCPTAEQHRYMNLPLLSDPRKNATALGQLLDEGRLIRPKPPRANLQHQQLKSYNTHYNTASISRTSSSSSADTTSTKFRAIPIQPMAIESSSGCSDFRTIYGNPCGPTIITIAAGSSSPSSSSSLTAKTPFNLELVNNGYNAFNGGGQAEGMTNGSSINGLFFTGNGCRNVFATGGGGASTEGRTNIQPTLVPLLAANSGKSKRMKSKSPNMLDVKKLHILSRSNSSAANNSNSNTLVKPSKKQRIKSDIEDEENGDGDKQPTSTKHVEELEPIDFEYE